MQWKALALLVLLGFAAVAAPVRAAAADDDDDVYDDDDDVEPAAPKAFLMVRRKLSEEKPQAGKTVTVLVELHNAGTSPATGVVAKEAEWNPEAFTTAGDLSAQFDSVPAGTTYSFSYSITPKFPLERYDHRPTVVTYVAEEGAQPVTTTSSWLQFTAYSSANILKLHALRVGSTLTLGGLNTPTDWMRLVIGAAALVVAYVSWSTYSSVSAMRKKNTSRRALKGLGISEDDLKTM